MGSGITRSRRQRRFGALAVAFALVAGLAFPLLGGPNGAGATGQDGDGPPANVNFATLESEPVQQWGVVGSGVSTNDPKPQVWDFAEIGNTIYVGGTFTGVQQNLFANTPVQPRAYLAAFDRDSGAWISTFNPTLNASVYALEVSPDGNLLVGGEFTTVNGQSRVGLVSLSPVTGATNTGFVATVGRLGVDIGTPTVRELQVDGTDLYVAGTFNQYVNGGNANFVYHVIRVRGNTGLLDPTWLPRPTGSGVWDVVVDHARNRVHLAGYFTAVNAQPDTANLATVTESTGAVVAGLTSYFSNDANQTWTRALALVNDRLYVGGAEHILQVLDGATRNRLGYETTGVSCDNFSPTSCPAPFYIGGGDMQVVEVAGNAILAGCHCFLPRPGFSPAYDGRMHYSSFSGLRTGNRNVVAYDPATSTPLPWAPGLRENVWGAWAIHVDKRGCVYVGGDYTRTDAGLWVGGFGRFCNPVTPPAALNGTSASTNVNLTWTAPTGQLPVSRYRVYRGATFIGETTGTSFTDTGRTPGTAIAYNVETVDASGRRSPAATKTVTVLGGADSTPPTVPTNLTAQVSGATVNLTWAASTDNVGVNGYLVHRDFQFVGFVAAGTTFTDPTVSNGPHQYEVRAQDAAGNNSAPATVGAQVGAVDTQAPTQPSDLTATVIASNVTLNWTASTDNVAVRGYLVHRDFQFVAFVTAGTTFADPGVANGPHLYEVRAQDTTGNNSTQATVTAQVGPPDTQPPTTPTNVTATVSGTTVTIGWTASTDNVAVRGYLVHRDGQFRAFVSAGRTYVDTGVAAGAHLYEVRAQDTTSNNSPPSPVSATV